MLRKSKRKGNKRGSSLPMVLAIGLVLVIWVTSLSPVIATQGKANIDVRNQEVDYLQSRSAIEFTKGELVNMVAQGTPETFVVLREGDGFAPYAWDLPQYNNHVDAKPYDKDDIPAEGDAGKDVAAICAVWKEAGERTYQIQITTYNEGETALSYNTTYTPPVLSKQVYPESYKKTEALPLSDFILVDGQLGSETLWYSPLTYSEDGEEPEYKHTNYIDVYTSGKNGMFKSYKSDYSEVLLPASDEADAGGYPAVFKVTAQAGYPEPVDDGVMDEDDALTDPTGITVVEVGEPYFSFSGLKKNSDGTVTVTLNSSTLLDNDLKDYTLFGCYNGSGSIQWQKSNTFKLGEGAYYFYCYVGGHFDARTNTVYTNSPIVGTAKAITIINYNSSKLVSGSNGPQDGTPYLLGSKRGTSLKYLYVNNNKLATDQIAQDITIYSNGVNLSNNTDGITIINGDAPTWNAQGSGENRKFEYIPLNEGKGIHFEYKSLGFSGEFSYGNLTSLVLVERITKDRLYYFDLDKSSFYNTPNDNDSSKIYFYQVPTNNGTTKSYVATVNALSSPIHVPDGTTVAEAKACFSVSNSLVDSGSLKIHLVQVADRKYQAYATWTKDGLPCYAYLGTVIVDPPQVEIPDPDELDGYGLWGRAMYFMDADYAFETYEDRTIRLFTDLLVIRGDLDEGAGSIILNPYDCTDTLAFFVEGTYAFQAYNFYQIPAGTNLKTVTPAQADAWLVRDNSGAYMDGTKVEYVDDDPTKGVESIVFPDRVITLETSGSYNYPVINFDVAYASDEQLAHVVSGRAARWVDENGVLIAKEDNVPNGWYVVCPYITDTPSGKVTRSANRILMVTESGNLQVKNTMRLVSRYWSIDAAEITQVGSSELQLFCLTSKENLTSSILSWLSSFLGDIDYSSDTMQVDYERDTDIVRSNSAFTYMPAQICRYENGINLFDGASSPENSKEDLRIEYDVNIINNAFSSEAINASIVERYMHLYGNTTDTLYIGRDWIKCELQLYSNYISFDSSIKKIHVDAGLTGDWSEIYAHSQLYINSQETGYTSDEYLYLFTRSAADTYTGTLLYFEDDVTVEYVKLIGSNEYYTIEDGFYYVPTGGKNYLAIENGKCLLSKYKIDPDDLDEYSKYINPNTGSMSSAYVDTGFETDEETIGGFGGGSVN